MRVLFSRLKLISSPLFFNDLVRNQICKRRSRSIMGAGKFLYDARDIDVWLDNLSKRGGEALKGKDGKAKPEGLNP